MDCRKIEPMLSEYLNNSLSARETLAVDRHLSECKACARFLNEMRQTVSLLAYAPRREVSEDFMANLQARLAQTPPPTPRRVWRDNLRAIFRPRTLPAWGMATAACALLVFMLIPRQVMTPPAAPTGTAVQTTDPLTQIAKNQLVALTASNPLDDLAAANLAASSADLESEATGDRATR
jgi:anti-sigma factor RsiW